MTFSSNKFSMFKKKVFSILFDTCVEFSNVDSRTNIMMSNFSKTHWNSCLIQTSKCLIFMIQTTQKLSSQQSQFLTFCSMWFSITTTKKKNRLIQIRVFVKNFRMFSLKQIEYQHLRFVETRKKTCVWKTWI